MSLCCAAVVLAKHWTNVQLVTKQPLNLVVLNLNGKDFAEAEKVNFNNLQGLLQDGYWEYMHEFYQLFTFIKYLVIASVNYVKEMNLLPEGTLDSHSASKRCGKNI